ncbi:MULTISPECIES: hypothetical protein [unclassified Microcoleus]|uniref:hypothetical protein n=1 Tax=unclassified Microcoleus TaxID=2642155 RepID=UPI002FD21807
MRRCEIVDFFDNLRVATHPTAKMMVAVLVSGRRVNWGFATVKLGDLGCCCRSATKYLHLLGRS